MTASGGSVQKSVASDFCIVSCKRMTCLWSTQGVIACDPAPVEGFANPVGSFKRCEDKDRGQKCRGYIKAGDRQVYEGTCRAKTCTTGSGAVLQPDVRYFVTHLPCPPNVNGFACKGYARPGDFRVFDGKCQDGLCKMGGGAPLRPKMGDF